MRGASRGAVVLLSGGIDSSTALAVAKSEGYELYALSFDYCQRHLRELESARLVASALGARDHLTIRFDLRSIGGSALTSGVEVPKGGRGSSAEGNELKETFSSAIAHHPPVIPVTYVPARNTIFLSFGLAWAEVLGAEHIFIGANVVDYSGYPDCRPEYIEAFERMANLATKASVEGKMRFRIEAPLIALRKSEIIRKGHELGLDFSLTWSCYDPQKRGVSAGMGGESDISQLVPCGRCDSCRFREEGFSEAGLSDPLGNLPVS